MEFRTLGSLEVAHDGRAIPVPGARQRQLLAALVLRRGQAVGVEHLMEWLWADHRPGNAANALQSHISHLRRVLGPGHAIVTRSPGYLLDVPADAVDAHRFESLLQQGLKLLQGGRPAAAAATLEEALGLWRGEPLADVRYPAMVAGELARLTELRLVALEAQTQARAALGPDAKLIPDLEAMLEQYPLREALWGQLMIALYRSGRQADALRAYASARRRLVDELGVEPGPQLRALEERILIHDPELLEAAPAVPASRSADTAAGATVAVGAPAPADRHNLRRRLDAFVGRQTELLRLDAALRAARLVTLVGPGGVGKTRLATEGAVGAQSRWSDGAWMVELAAVTDAAGLAGAVSSELGVHDGRLGPGRHERPEDAIAAYIGRRTMLVVLDNCEHLTEAVAALVERLLASCAQLRILATSREQLFVPGEFPLHVHPLPTADAVALFEDRARAARPGIDLSGNERIVADICRRLDGLPLAVELAAARVRALSPAQLAERLDDRFRLLSGGHRTAAPRHQTLRATIDWSHDLLSAEEQRLFRRLSVFRDGFSLDAAEAICSDADLDRSEVLDVLTHLADKSLVNVVHDDLGDVRYRQLESLHDYGRERLAAAGEADLFGPRHSAWYRSVAARIEDGLHGPEGLRWRRLIAVEIGNIRAALEDAIERGDAAAALDLAVGVRWYFFLEGDWHSIIRWLDEALAVQGEARAVHRAQATSMFHYFSAILDGPAAHLAPLEQAVDDLRRLHAGRPLVQGLHQLASTHMRAGEALPVLAALEESAEVLTRFDLPWERAMRWRLLATALARQDELAKAEAAARKAVETFAATGEQFIVLEAQSLLGDIAEARDDLVEAVSVYTDIVERSGRLQLAAYRGYFTLRLAGLRSRLGDDPAADALYRKVPEVTRSVLIVTAALVGRGAIARRAARRSSSDAGRAQWLSAAEAFYEQARVDYATSGQADGEAVALAGLAWCAFERGDVEQSVLLVARSHARARQAPEDPGRVAHAAALAVEAALSEQADPARARQLLDEVVVLRAGGGWAVPAADEPDLAALAERLTGSPPPGPSRRTP